MGGTQDDAALGVLAGDDGGFIHTGRFRSVAEFDLGPTTETLTSFGSQDIYLASYASIQGLDDATHFLSSADLTNRQG